MTTPVPDSTVPGDTFQPDTEEAQRRSQRRAPLCPDGEERATFLRFADEAGSIEVDGETFTWEAGDPFWSCLDAAVVYMPATFPAVLAEILFPDDWSIVPPG